MSRVDSERVPFLDKTVQDIGLGPTFTQTRSMITTANFTNFAYIFTASGILNFFQLLGSAICLATTLYHCQPTYSGKFGSFIGNYKETFFVLSNFGSMTSVTLMYLCNTISLKTAQVLSKTTLGVIFNAGLFALNTSSTFFIFQSIEAKVNSVYSHIEYNWKLVVSIIGLINSSVYALGVLNSYKTFLRDLKQKFPVHS